MSQLNGESLKEPLDMVLFIVLHEPAQARSMVDATKSTSMCSADNVESQGSTKSRLTLVGIRWAANALGETRRGMSRRRWAKWRSRVRGHRLDTRAGDRRLTNDQAEQRLLGLDELLAVANGDDAAEQVPSDELRASASKLLPQTTRMASVFAFSLSLCFLSFFMSSFSFSTYAISFGRSFEDFVLT
jgi:hypothetical protein